MKKLLFTTSIIALLFAGCSKDDDGGGKSCEDRANDVIEAAQAFANDTSEANCNDYRDAIEAYANSDCPNSDQYDMILEGLDCSNL